MPINSRTKGKVGESQFIQRFNMFFPEELKRNLLQVREGGADISGCHPFQIEVKRCQKLEFDKWWRQVNKALCSEEEIPIVAYRKNHGKWRFLIPAALVVDHNGYMDVEEDIFIKLVMRTYR